MVNYPRLYDCIHPGYWVWGAYGIRYQVQIVKPDGLVCQNREAMVGYEALVGFSAFAPEQFKVGDRLRYILSGNTVTGVVQRIGLDAQQEYLLLKTPEAEWRVFTPDFLVPVSVPRGRRKGQKLTQKSK